MERFVEDFLRLNPTQLTYLFLLLGFGFFLPVIIIISERIPRRKNK
jgi:hypothetical protein